MKKLKFFLFVLVGMFPIMCSALEKEVNYRWYTLVEDNVRYESNPKDVCEYYDLESVIYSDWVTSFVKPDEYDYRIIKEEMDDVHIKRDLFDKLNISAIEMNGIRIKILELGFYNLHDGSAIKGNLTNYVTSDINNIFDDDLSTFIEINPITEFKFRFDDLLDVKDLKVVLKFKDESIIYNGMNFDIGILDTTVLNYFSQSELNINTNCSDGVCVSEMFMKDEFFNDDIIIKENVYKYQDKMYKCYDYKRVYVPGYYSELEGFIKDENDYVEIIKEVSVETEINNNDSDNTFNDILNKEVDDIVIEDSLDNNEIVNVIDEELDDTLEDLIKEDNKQLAVVTEKSKDNKSIFPYVLMLAVLFMISVLAFFVRKVIISRTK